MQVTDLSERVGGVRGVGGDGGGGGADTLVTAAAAAVCVGGGRLTEVTDGGD